MLQDVLGAHRWGLNAGDAEGQEQEMSHAPFNAATAVG
jgi:hypothetical protein